MFYTPVGHNQLNTMNIETIKEKTQSIIAHSLAVVAKPVAKVSRFISETFAKLKDLILES